MPAVRFTVDTRLCRPENRAGGLFSDFSAVAPASFATPWWPLVAGLVGDGGLDVALLEASKWGQFDPAAGASSSYGFAGVTRNEYGSALGDVTVKAFLTATDTLVMTVVSDVNGEYLLPTPYYPSTHYLVFYKTGSPDVFGTSANSLIGT